MTRRKFPKNIAKVVITNGKVNAPIIFFVKPEQEDEETNIKYDNRIRDMINELSPLQKLGWSTYVY